MTITELGALGEFVGAIAVVATLIYLAVQVKQTRKAVLGNTYQSRTDSLASRFLVTATNSQLLDTLHKTSHPGYRLTDEELYQAQWYWRAATTEVDNVHYQYEMGTFPREIADAVGRQIATWLAEDDQISSWWEKEKPGQRPSFARWIDGWVRRVRTP